MKRLTKGNRRQLNGTHIFNFMHDRSRFSGKIHSRLLKKTKFPKILIHAFDAYPCSHIHKNRIAGIHKSLCECLTSVAA